MRDGLKRRIQGKGPYTLSSIKTNYTPKSVFNYRIGNTTCAPTGACDGSIVNGTSTKRNLEQRMYYAPFRQPVKGWRKNLDCSGNIVNKCLKYTEIYKDPYTNCSGTKCLSNGSLPTTNIPTPTWGQTRASSGITTRTSRPLIRSGMQPNSAGQQNSGKPVVLTNNPKRYSYSYRELLNNRRKDTYMKKLATAKPTNPLYMSSNNNTVKMPGYGGNCPSTGLAINCDYGHGENIYKLNNDKFRVQGAVQSSTRLERLKLDAIRGESNCPPWRNQSINRY